jgi:hypothetical protein
MSPARVSELVFIDPDTVGEMIHNFDRDTFDAPIGGGDLHIGAAMEIEGMPLSTPTDLGQPLATWLWRSSPPSAWSLCPAPQIEAQLKAPCYLTLDDGTNPV